MPAAGRRKGSVAPGCGLVDALAELSRESETEPCIALCCFLLTGASLPLWLWSCLRRYGLVWAKHLWTHAPATVVPEMQ